MEYTEKQISSEVKYRGIIVTVRDDIAELHNGKKVHREVVEHPGGVGIVAVDSESNVYVVRQFRYPYERELVEIPAGKLEPGEDPLECAVRELSEETGLSAKKYEYLGGFYPSPGYCREVLHIYLATELESGRAHLDDDEFLDVEKIPMDKFVSMIMKCEIKDAKTIIGVLKAEKVLKERER